MWVAIDQPTMALECKSKTVARYSQPCWVHILVMKIGDNYDVDRLSPALV